MKTLKIKCPAKINLNLRITGKRKDGFHNIESIMQTINLFDYLTISVENNLENEIILTGNSDQIPYDEHNLVYKASKLFLEIAEIKNQKISINIEKNIPVSAGLAGGSTDAAGTIFGLNEIFNKPLPEIKMHEICSKLGSDLNVCLKGGKIFAKGRGEIIEPMPFEELNLSLIKPLNLGISAKEAYTKYSQKIKTVKELPPAVLCATSPCKGEDISDDICPLSGGNAEATAKAKGIFSKKFNFVNDLEWAVIDDYKELQHIKEKYPKSVMTGSGSTYFIIDDEFEQEKNYWTNNNLKSINYGVCIA